MASWNNYVPLARNRSHSFHCELKMNKEGDRISVDSGEKQYKTKTWIKKDGFKLELGSILDWRLVEAC